MKPDETIPGGYYIGVDGTPHDAHGNQIPVIPDIAQIEDIAETPAQAEEAIQQETRPAETRRTKAVPVEPDPVTAPETLVESELVVAPEAPVEPELTSTNEG